jgi:hypothetical protein
METGAARLIPVKGLEDFLTGVKSLLVRHGIAYAIGYNIQEGKSGWILKIDLETGESTRCKPERVPADYSSMTLVNDTAYLSSERQIVAVSLSSCRVKYAFPIESAGYGKLTSNHNSLFYMDLAGSIQEYDLVTHKPPGLKNKFKISSLGAGGAYATFTSIHVVGRLAYLGTTAGAYLADLGKRKAVRIADYQTTDLHIKNGMMLRISEFPSIEVDRAPKWDDVAHSAGQFDFLQ